MITDSWEYTNRYDAGQVAVNNGNWRLAFDCFNDCLEYLKRKEPWRENEISNLEKLVENCNAMFR